MKGIVGDIHQGKQQLRKHYTSISLSFEILPGENLIRFCNTLLTDGVLKISGRTAPLAGVAFWDDTSTNVLYDTI